MKKLPKNSFIWSILTVIFLSAVSLTSSASENVVYKEARPLKNIFETDNSADTPEKNPNYIYDPEGKTDPFKSFIALQEEKEEKEKSKPKTYLETLELSQLDISVIVISSKGKWAMVRDSKGVGHVIKEGTAIGNNGGLVYNIDRGAVVIRENYKDFRGRDQHRDIIKKSPSAQ